MPNGRLVRLVAALVVLAPLACATQARRDQQRAVREAAIARVPANAPGGVFVNGLWLGTMTGQPPLQRVGNTGWGGGSSSGLPMPAATVMRHFDVEVDAWRDSARVAFILNDTQGMRAGRVLPRDLRVEGNRLTFGLANVLGWTDVSCRLVETSAQTWDGPCTTTLGERAAWLSIGLPHVASR